MTVSHMLVYNGAKSSIQQKKRNLAGIEQKYLVQLFLLFNTLQFTFYTVTKGKVTYTKRVILVWVTMFVNEEIAAALSQC